MSDSESIFTKIINREIPADIVYEDDVCISFRDVNPQAPKHLLVVPKEPIERVGAADSSHQTTLGHLLLKAAEVAKSEGLSESGFRIVINNGRDGGETVPHLHVHVLGGRALSWPPG